MCNLECRDKCFNDFGVECLMKVLWLNYFWFFLG